MTMIIDDVVTSFSSKMSSHKAAWPRMQACMVEDLGHGKPLLAGNKPWTVLDGIWLVSTPMEFGGDTFNLFGGFTQEVHDRISRILDMDLGNIKALEKPLPNIQAILGERAAKAQLDFTKAEWQKIVDITNAPVLTHEALVPNVTRVVIGDSHSIARYRRGTIVYRHDGLTLHGLTTRGVESYLPDYRVEHLVISAGNIDIRHHLARQFNPLKAAVTLVEDLHKQLTELQVKDLIGSFEVTSPYPIEFEQRRIPKSGYYKKTPFYGTREKRNQIREVFQNRLEDLFTKVHAWPRSWYEMDPEEYAKVHMEKPGSVHLSPEFYEWNLETNEANKWVS